MKDKIIMPINYALKDKLKRYLEPRARIESFINHTIDKNTQLHRTDEQKCLYFIDNMPDVDKFSDCSRFLCFFT